MRDNDFLQSDCGGDPLISYLLIPVKPFGFSLSAAAADAVVVPACDLADAITIFVPVVPGGACTMTTFRELVTT